MKLVSEAWLEGLTITMAQVFSERRLYDMADILEETKLSETVEEKYKPFSLLELLQPDSFVAEIQVSLSDTTWKVQDILPARPLQTVAVTGTTQLPRYSARYELFYLDEAIDRELLLKSCQELISRNEIPDSLCRVQTEVLQCCDRGTFVTYRRLRDRW